MHQFSAAETARIVSGCKVRGVSIASLLQAAILHAMSVVDRTQQLDTKLRTYTVPATPVSFLSLVPEQLHGNFSATTGVPLSVDIKPGQEVEETCRIVKDGFRIAREFQVRDIDAYVSALLKMFPSTA